MRSTVLVIALLIATSPLAVATGASGARFTSPAQWNGSATIDGAEWVVVVFSPTDVGGGTFSSSEDLLATQFQVAKPQYSTDVSRGAAPHDLPSEQEELGPLDANIGFSGASWKSLLIQAEQIEVIIAEASGNLKVGHAGDAMEASVPDSDFPVGALRMGGHQLPSDMVFLNTREPRHFSWRLEARGIQALEIHNATLDCATPECPETKESSQPLPESSPLHVEILSYLNLRTTGGNAAFTGTGWAIGSGGATLDVGIHGEIRLPGFQLNACSGQECLSAKGETFSASGNLSLNDLVVDDRNHVRGSIQVNSGRARLDETPIDAAILGSTAAVTVAAVGIGVVLVKLLGPLFTRIRSVEATHHPSRKLLLDTIAANPGISFSGLVRATQLPNGTARHHLNVLSNLGLIETRTIGPTLCHFPIGTDRSAWESLAVLQDLTSRQLCALVAQIPGVNQRALIAGVSNGVPRSSVQFKLRRLVKAEVLTAHRVGRRSHYGPGRFFPALPLGNALEMVVSGPLVRG